MRSRKGMEIVKRAATQMILALLMMDSVDMIVNVMQAGGTFFH